MYFIFIIFILFQHFQYWLTFAACESGYWGRGCLSKCLCKEISVGCDPVTGQCVCEAGFTGDHCENSKSALFQKVNAATLWCLFIITCFQLIYNIKSIFYFSNFNFCIVSLDSTIFGAKYGIAHDRHFAFLMQHFYRHFWSACLVCSLSECVNGSYGQRCTQQCQCQNGALCDHVSGACTCSPGYAGTSCEKSKISFVTYSVPDGVFCDKSTAIHTLLCLESFNQSLESQTKY